MRKTLFLVLMAMWLFVSNMQAQVKESPAPRYLSTQKKHTVTIQPTQWFNWGWRFDYEIRLNEGPGWLQVGPSFYWVTKESDSFSGNWNDTRKGFHEPFKNLKGGGLDINYKRYIDRRRGAYVAAGLSYTLLNIDYYGGRGVWKDYMEDGLPYHQYTYTVGTHTQTINRFGMSYYFGYQIPSVEIFILDLFCGISYRHAFSDKSMWRFDKVFSYGYNGAVPMVGVRFGIGVK